jgi:predicted Rossmann-fold nucleotide-binding protein
VYGDRAAIAVLGPTRAEGPRSGRATDLAGALGHHLGRSGYVVVVEGHGLVAQAAARAARQVDATVVAVEASEHPSWTALPGVRLEVVPGAFGALERVLALADALVVLAGDLRAVALLTQVWSWGLEPDAPFRQIVLVGEGWTEAVRTLADAVHLDQKTRAMVTFAKEAGEALDALRYYVAPSK